MSDIETQNRFWMVLGGDTKTVFAEIPAPLYRESAGDCVGNIADLRKKMQRQRRECGFSILTESSSLYGDSDIEQWSEQAARKLRVTA